MEKLEILLIILMVSLVALSDAYNHQRRGYINSHSPGRYHESGHGYHHDNKPSYHGNMHHVGGGDSPQGQPGNTYNHNYHQHHYHYYYGNHGGDDRGHHSGRPENGSQENQEVGGVSYTFQMGDNFGAYEYTDTTGKLKGFYMDVVNKVCETAGQTCHIVYDDPENCWQSKGNRDIPGIGLLAGWYDGCVGYSQSPERINSFDFTQAFTRNFAPSLFVTAEAALSCSPADLTGLRIGFIKGWAVSPACISRHFNIKGNQIGENGYNASYYLIYEDLITAIVKNEVDAIFTVNEYVPEALNLRPLCGVTFQCTRAGISTMVRKGSPVQDWWDRAFQSMVDSGQYKELCSKAVRAHGYRGQVHCLET